MIVFIVHTYLVDKQLNIRLQNVLFFYFHFLARVLGFLKWQLMFCKQALFVFETLSAKIFAKAETECANNPYLLLVAGVISVFIIV
jgi:hypothetical protein